RPEQHLSAAGEGVSTTTKQKAQAISSKKSQCPNVREGDIAGTLSRPYKQAPDYRSNLQELTE
ncbi:hypothetical protein, partial [Sagittula salina]